MNHSHIYFIKIIIILDDNECLRIPPPCRGISQCVNTPGSFECQCPDGYKLGSTARECVGKLPFIYYVCN